MGPSSLLYSNCIPFKPPNYWQNHWKFELINSFAKAHSAILVLITDMISLKWRGSNSENPTIPFLPNRPQDTERNDPLKKKTTTMEQPPPLGLRPTPKENLEGTCIKPFCQELPQRRRFPNATVHLIFVKRNVRRKLNNFLDWISLNWRMSLLKDTTSLLTNNTTSWMTLCWTPLNTFGKRTYKGPTPTQLLNQNPDNPPFSD